METNFAYIAFISYKREDKKWAQWLHRKLEHYKLPSSVRKANAALPEKVRPIFRDTTDLEPGFLAENIRKGLEQSRYLIVICSPRAARSKYVNYEIEEFIKQCKTGSIIPFIIEGSPNAADPAEECFPPALRALSAEQELLGANISEMGRNAAAVKVISRMLNVKFNILWQRDEREQRRKRWFAIGASLLVALAAIGLLLFFKAQNTRLKINQARAVAQVAERLIEQGDIYTAQRICVEALPEKLDWWRFWERPYVPEVERALRVAIDSMENSTYGSIAILRNSNTVLGMLSAMVSFDGTKIAAAAYDNTIRVRDIYTGREIGLLEGHTDIVLSAVFSRDDKKIVSTSRDATIRIWDVESGLELKKLQVEPKYIGYAAELSPDNKKIAYAYEDKVILLNMETDEEMILTGHNGAITSISFSSDGQRILSASSDDTMKEWDANTGKILVSMERERAWGIRQATFSPDNKKIVSIADRWDIMQIWDAETMELLHTIEDIGYPYYATFSPDGKKIVSASADTGVQIWDAETGKELKTLGNKNGYLSATFSTNGKYIIATSVLSANSFIQIWNNETEPQCLNSVDIGNNVRFSDNGKYVIWSSDYDFSRKKYPMYRLNTETGELLGLFQSYPLEVVNSNGDKVLYSAASTIRIKDITNDDEIILEGHTEQVNSAKFSSDSKMIVSASNDKTIRVWNTETGQELKRLEGHMDDVNCAVFSPDMKTIISVSADKTTRIWDVDTGKELKCLQNSAVDFNGNTTSESIAFSPDGKLFVTTYENIGLRIWETKTCKLLKTMNNINEVYSVSFSPDGKRIISSGFRYIKIWDVDSGLELKRIECGYRRFRENNGRFGEDNRSIIYADNYNIPKLVVIDFPPLQELIDQTRERFKDRPLTDEEREMYYLQ